MIGRYIKFVRSSLHAVRVARQLTCFAFLMGCQLTAHADTWTLGGWDITGFGTIGYAETDKYNDVVLKRNITQKSQDIEDNRWWIDSRLGIQARKELSPGWDAVGQIVAQKKVENSIEDAIEMAFVRYHSGENFSFRLGRMALDTFQLSDYRNVGYSYHWVRPPTEFYGWIPYSHYDGFKGVYEVGDFDSLLRFEAFLGKSKSTVNIGYKDDVTSKNYVKSAPVFGGGLTWEKDDLTLRAYISRYRFTENTNALKALLAYTSDPLIAGFWPEAQTIANDYAIENVKVTYGAIGFSWTPGSWHTQAEISFVNPKNFGTYDGERAYVQLGYRLGQFLPHITYSRSWDNRDFPYDPPPPSGSGDVDNALNALYATLKDNLSSGKINQYTVSLGLRWDFATQKAMKLQCDRTTLNENSLGVFPTQNTIGNQERQFAKDTRTWCSATLDWVF
ncbi:MAG: porin [Oleiphilus sp.]